MMTFSTQILIVLLIGRVVEKHYQDLGRKRHKSGISIVVNLTSFCGATSGGVAKCQLFSQGKAGETAEAKKPMTHIITSKISSF